MSGVTPATFEEFERECAGGNVVPVVRVMLADLQTPVGAFLRIAQQATHAFLLESIEGGERLARYSFLGANPWMIVRARGAQTIVTRGGREEISAMHPMEFVRDHFRGKSLVSRQGLAPLIGGAVGYLGYAAARWFEPVLNGSGADETGSEALWMFFRTVIAFDHVRQQMEIASIVLTDEAAGDRLRLRELYEQAVAETERMEATLNESFAIRSAAAGAVQAADEPYRSNWPRNEFEQAVEKVKEYIAAGDCYQAVIAQQFSKASSADPLSIYRALRAANPSPYMYFLRASGESIIGASPEMLVRCHGRQLEYRPIAGTRKRGLTAAEDASLADEMRHDEKEVAEHVMLVDLGRNDLGRVSDYGSVTVDELMTVERYSHVQHLVSGLRSRLRVDLDRFDALAACFPAGTVTGAPKIRAMQIINELEPAQRGVYAGAVLYVDYADNLDSCIAIRTIEMRDGIATVQTGAGIVADSVPANEFEECVNKARAMFQAIEMAEAGL